MREQSYIFAADTAVLVQISEYVAQAAHLAGFNDIEIGDIQLAVDEACTNTINHGLKKDPELTFNVVIRWNKNEIEISIYETGVPFDPTAAPMPDLNLPLEERPIGGLGVYFMRKLMDEIEYRIDGSGVKTLRMIKRKI